jgi:hypothetical protein
MSPLPPSQSTFSFDFDTRTLLFVALSLAPATFVVLATAYVITQWRLESKYRWAIFLSETVLLIARESEAAQDPQGRYGSASTEFSKAINR